MRCILTQQDLQGVGVQVQSLRLLLHHIHLLRLLVVVAVDAGVGQDLQTAEQGTVNTAVSVSTMMAVTVKVLPCEPERGLYRRR